MPYKLSSDGRSVMVWKGGRWKLLKRYPSRAKARKYLIALKINVEK